MFRMQSSSHLHSLASTLLLSTNQADVTFVTSSITLSELLGLCLKQEESLQTTSTSSFHEDDSMKEGEIHTCEKQEMLEIYLRQFFGFSAKFRDF